MAYVCRYSVKGFLDASSTLAISTSLSVSYICIVNSTTIAPKPRINNQIKAPKVRLIDDKGENVGVVDLQAALQAAYDKDLDLVEIAPTAVPPVVRIIDVGKLLYQQEKQLKKQKAKQKSSELKVVKIGLSTSDHDAGIKIKQIGEFLAEGNKVKVDMFLRGRERANKAFARQKFDAFLQKIQFDHTIEQPTKALPTGFFIIIGK